MKRCPLEAAVHEKFARCCGRNLSKIFEAGEQFFSFSQMGLLNVSESGAVPLLLGIVVIVALVWLLIKRFTLVVHIVFALLFAFECVGTTQLLASGTELSQGWVEEAKLVQFLSLIYVVAAVLAAVGRIKRDVFILLTVVPFMYFRIYPDITLKAAFLVPLPHFAFGVFGLASATSA